MTGFSVGFIAAVILFDVVFTKGGFVVVVVVDVFVVAGFFVVFINLMITEPWWLSGLARYNQACYLMLKVEGSNPGAPVCVSNNSLLVS